ncbi:hypothetical protein [Flavobacterium sp.]|uniref:hypothetical protein n=1 Tax=Flavobacterium sp. TaxID=239 RepID=UPI0025DC9623|nr:hypothetical protein [Flavobacterium sp.]
MKTFKNFKTLFTLSLFFIGVSILSISCSKSDSGAAAYRCLACRNAPDALAANDASGKGIYKGVAVGSSGTLSINIQNGVNTITANMVLDGISASLTSNVTYVDGQAYVAPFTGTYNGTSVSITFSIAIGGAMPTVTSSSIPGHPNIVFTLYKETSTSLLEAFEGTYSKTGESGIFNIILSTGLARWGGIVKKDVSGITGNISGTYVNNNVIDDNGKTIGVISVDELHGSFLDGNGATVTTTAHRTL